MIKKKNYKKSLFAGVMAVILGSSVLFQENVSVKAEDNGRWMTGEYHVHTVQSNDVSEKDVNIKNILDTGFNKYGYDWLMFADHLRMSPREINGEPVFDSNGEESKEARYKAIEKQLEEIKKLKEEGKYTDKIIYTGFEWDMLGYDHASVGIIEGDKEVPIDAIKEFEYLFSKDTNESEFEQEYKDQLGQRLNSDDKENTYKAIDWLKENYPESYVLPNHPSRKNGDKAQMNVEDIRAMNDLAPNIVFGFEGMPGNQMAASNNRAELTDVYGGTDVMVAQVGGLWDSLLGEGRHFYNFTNSDFHFKVSTNRKYSSGYWPGEYAKNYTWVDGNDIQAVVDGMRSGKSFSVYGDLINALDFNAESSDKKADMGSDLEVTQGDDYTLTIRFKSPETNNYEAITEHETNVTNKVKVDHIDLIAGDITGKISPNSPDYNKDTNESTKVIARFTEEDWKVDSEGYNVITYQIKDADSSKYYRLRGTNLGTDVEGETENGEPLIDESFDYSGTPTAAENEERFNNLNDRNYSDMWFYSNPIFVNVKEYSNEEAVNDTLSIIDDSIKNIGDLENITEDFILPLSGLHGARIEWKSSNEEIISLSEKENEVLADVKRPKLGEEDGDVILSVSVKRGAYEKAKEYKLKVKALKEEITEDDIEKPEDNPSVNDPNDETSVDNPKDDLGDDKLESNSENKGELPETGGNNPIYLLILAIFAVGIGASLVLRKRAKEN
ncbi:immunoglobulin-like domain-containing protein [Clostridium sp.]|uniref:immunoglobulin-like domain-containing protein n=1 Tax=Clostridium sp. TaxID=1506 RepID=UPI0025BB5B01|nr:immunoglobulin-like domain-containing protein [Clostridium sp.]